MTRHLDVRRNIHTTIYDISASPLVYCTEVIWALAYFEVTTVRLVAQTNTRRHCTILGLLKKKDIQQGDSLHYITNLRIAGWCTLTLIPSSTTMQELVLPMRTLYVWRIIRFP